jgi:hypothetical protein
MVVAYENDDLISLDRASNDRNMMRICCLHSLKILLVILKLNRD